MTLFPFESDDLDSSTINTDFAFIPHKVVTDPYLNRIMYVRPSFLQIDKFNQVKRKIFTIYEGMRKKTELLEE